MIQKQVVARLIAGALTLCSIVNGVHADGRNVGNQGNQNQRGHAKPAKQYASKTTRIALIGDLPYRDRDIPRFDEVLREINESGVDFTIHTGDIKSGSSLCDDALLKARFDQLAQLKNPLIYTPGDNEWTDCHRPAAGSFEPLDRLAKIRALFFPRPGVSLGQKTLRVKTQATDAAYKEFVENVRFTQNDVVFATLHIVGSNNNKALWAGIGETAATPRADRVAEAQRRIQATVAWIDATFDEAERVGAAGVLLAQQANPSFESATGAAERDGFEEIIAKLTTRTIAFGRPVLVAHGDTHYYRYDKPLLGPTVADGQQRLEDLYRAENFGDLDVHWVELTVDARSAEVFKVQPHIVEANRFER